MNRHFELAPFNAGETITSHASRLAAASGYESANAYARAFGFSFGGLAMGKTTDILSFAQAVDRHVDLFEDGIVRSDNKVHIMRGERLSSGQVDRKRLRFCSLCLAEDEKSGAGRRGFRAFGRLLWQVIAVRACPCHNVALNTFGAFGAPPDYDFSAMLRAYSGAVERTNLFSMPPDPLQTYVVKRLCREPHDRIWLDEMSMHDAIALTEIVGAISRHGVQKDVSLLDGIELSRCAAQGFEILRRGEQAFRDFVFSLLHSEAGAGGSTWGGGRLGQLNSLLYFSVDDFEGIVRGIIRDAGGNAMLAAGWRPPPSSVASIAAEHDVDAVRLRGLLADAGVIERRHSPIVPRLIAIDDSLGAIFAAELKKTCNRPEARKHLGASSAVFDGLAMHYDLQAQPWAITDRPQRYTRSRFLTVEIERISADLQAAITTESAAQQWMEIEEVARFAESTVEEVLLLLLGGNLLSVACKAEGPARFQDIRLDPDDVLRQLSLMSRGALSLAAVAKKISASEKSVEVLIARKMIRSLRKGSARTASFERVVQRREVARFDECFATLKRLASIYRKPPSTVRRRLVAQGAEPAMVIEGVLFYRRHDISF
ncbi:TniQ family protein [Rhizobium leguminosarum]